MRTVEQKHYDDMSRDSPPKSDRIRGYLSRSTFCDFTAIKEYFFPDREKVIQAQLEKFDRIIGEFQRQVNDKEHEVERLKLVMADLNNTSLKTPTNTFLLKETRNKMKMLFAEICMIQRYQKIFLATRLKLQTFQNTALVNNEMKSFQKNFKMDIRDVVDANHSITDINNTISEADARLEHITKNLWDEDESLLERDFQLFLGEYEETNDVEVTADHPIEVKVEKTKKPILA